MHQPGSADRTERIAARRRTMRLRALCATTFTIVGLLIAGPQLIARNASDAGGSRLVSAHTQEVPLTQYRAYRRMHARNERFNSEGWLEAWTEMDGRGFRYEVVSERGSEYMRTKVLRGVLKLEQDLVAAGECAKSELTPDNYMFSDEVIEGPGEKYVAITPKRKGVLLVDGRMVLSGDGRELLRVEGRLSKNPSFWTSLVNVIRHYARLDGVRVPVATESVAKVKLAGLAQLDVQYEYETINGRPVSLAARRMISAVGGQR